MLRLVSSHVPKRPQATPSRTLSVERPSQENSQSWIVPAPFVARCESQPSAISEATIAGAAVLHQVGAVDQHHRRPAAARLANPCRGLLHHGGLGSLQCRRRRTRIDEDFFDRRKAPPRGKRIDATPAQVQRRAGPTHAAPPAALPKTTSSSASASRKSGMSTSAPTPRKPPPLPLVHAARAVVGLVAGHGDRQPAGALRVLDLDVAVAEAQQPIAGNRVFFQNPLDHHLLRETLIGVQRAVDSRAEIASDVQQSRLGLDARLVRAAGQVKRQPMGRQPLQQRPGAVDQELVGPDAAGPEPLDPLADPPVEPAQVFVLVPERLARLAAALANPIGQLDHLIDRLLAVQAHDVFVGQALDVGLVFAGQAGEHLDEHRRHHFRPALADQRQRAVEIEEHVADFRPRAEAGAEFDQPGELAILVCCRLRRQRHISSGGFLPCRSWAPKDRPVCRGPQLRIVTEPHGAAMAGGRTRVVRCGALRGRYARSRAFSAVGGPRPVL